jgi:hypothetical protein
MGDKRKKHAVDTSDPADRDVRLEPQGAATHPEELRASITLRIGDWVTLSAAARTTPAGIVAGGLALTAIMVPLIWITRRR